MSRGLSPRGGTRWLLEGTARWAEGEHQVLDGEATLEDLRERWLSDLSPHTPTLHSTATLNSTEIDGAALWEYTLGWLATDLLAARGGTDTWIEFWRRPTTPIETELDWRTAFQEVFGLSVQSFYVEFDAWQREQISGRMYVVGEITTSDGRPLAAGTPVWATCRQRPDHCDTHTSAHTRTNQQGRFAIRVPTDGRWYITIDWESCTMFVRDSTVTTNFSARSLMRVESGGVRLPPLQIPAGLCAHRISGRVLDVSGMPLAFAQIMVASSSSALGTDDRGRFEIRVPSDGAYSFNLGIDACWFSLDGQTLGSPNNPVQVDGADVTDIVLRLPGTIEELCG